MATVTWVGAAPTVPQVDTVTVTGNDASTSYRLTVNGKTVAVGGAASAALTAAALQAAAAASTEPEFAELTFGDPSGAAFAVTGPATGAPFTLSASVSGGAGTVSRSTTTAASSPNHASLAANYSGGALPAASDALVFEESAVSVLYGLTALAAVALASVTRRATFTGRIGLPDVNDNGYAEYRTRELTVDAPAVLVESPASDAAGQVRLLSAAGSAVTLAVAGDGAGGGLGAEAVEVRGLPSGSTVTATGAGVAVAVRAGQVAAVATLRVAGGSARCGAGVTLGAAELRDSDARLDCSYTTLAVDGTGTVTVAGAAAGTNTVVDGGTVAWRSTGSPGTVKVGPGGAVDFGRAPASVSLGAAAELSAGAAWLDPAGRVARPYSLTLVRAEAAEVTLDLGAGRTIEVS